MQKEMHQKSLFLTAKTPKRCQVQYYFRSSSHVKTMQRIWCYQSEWFHRDSRTLMKIYCKLLCVTLLHSEFYMFIDLTLLNWMLEKTLRIWLRLPLCRRTWDGVVCEIGTAHATEKQGEIFMNRKWERHINIFVGWNGGISNDYCTTNSFVSKFLGNVLTAYCRPET